MCTLSRRKSHCRLEKFGIYCPKGQIYHCVCNILVCFCKNIIKEAKYRHTFKTSLVIETKIKDSTKKGVFIVPKSGILKPSVPVLELFIVLC
jgi:hypothetical protein